MGFLNNLKSRTNKATKHPKASNSTPRVLGTPSTALGPMSRAASLTSIPPSIADNDSNFTDTDATEPESPENEPLPRPSAAGGFNQPTTPVPNTQNFSSTIANALLPTIWGALNTGPFREDLTDQDAASFGAYPAEVIDLPPGHEGTFRHALNTLCEALESIPRAVGSFRAFVLCPRCRITFEVSFSTLVDVPEQEPRRDQQGELVYQGPLGGIYCSTCGKIRPEI